MTHYSCTIYTAVVRCNTRQGTRYGELPAPRNGMAIINAAISLQHGHSGVRDRREQRVTGNPWLAITSQSAEGSHSTILAGQLENSIRRSI